jgi:hypothetical protein
VPLNTALLAVQNLESEGVYETVDKDQRDMVDGLQASLTMMEKVLNDVLRSVTVPLFTNIRTHLNLVKLASTEWKAEKYVRLTASSSRLVFIDSNLLVHDLTQATRSSQIRSTGRTFS